MRGHSVWEISIHIPIISRRGKPKEMKTKQRKLANPKSVNTSTSITNRNALDPARLIRLDCLVPEELQWCDENLRSAMRICAYEATELHRELKVTSIQTEMEIGSFDLAEGSFALVVHPDLLENFVMNLLEPIVHLGPNMQINEHPTTDLCQLGEVCFGL